MHLQNPCSGSVVNVRIAFDRTMSAQKTRAATQLLLQIQSQPQCITGALLPAKWVQSCGTDSSTEKDLIWCTDLLKGRSNAARAALSGALPPHCEVVYYNPREEENPTVSSKIDNMTGDELVQEGTWCLVFRAPNAQGFVRTVYAFCTAFMGLNGPMTDNSFLHQSGQKFLTKNNRNPGNGNTWKTRFSFKVEFVGEISDDISEMLETMMHQLEFFNWSGKYAYDPKGDFALRHVCECTSLEDSVKKWMLTKSLFQEAIAGNNPRLDVELEKLLAFDAAKFQNTFPAFSPPVQTARPGTHLQTPAPPPGVKPQLQASPSARMEVELEKELEKLLAQGAVELKNNGFVATRPPVQSAPSGAHLHQSAPSGAHLQLSSPPSGDSPPSPVTPAPQPPCHEEPSSPPKRQKISHDHNHQDEKLKALERLLDGKDLTCMQPPSVPINVLTRSGTSKVLWPDGSLTDEELPVNEAAIVPFSGEGQKEDLLSDEEATSFTAALEEGVVFMKKHHAGIKKSLVEAEQWSLLTRIQNAVDVMDACMTTKPSSRSTAKRTLEWVCSNLRAHPQLCQCANELVKWNCPPEPWMTVHKSLETHWDEVKALLVESEKWVMSSNLTSAREVMASTMANGQVMADNDRSLVQDSVQAIKDLVSADDSPTVLNQIVWP